MFRPSAVALGIDGDRLASDPGDGSWDRGAVLGVQLSVGSIASGVQDSFAGLLEAPAAVAAHYRNHAVQVREAGGMYMTALYTAGRDALEKAFPGETSRTVSADDLAEIERRLVIPAPPAG